MGGQHVVFCDILTNQIERASAPFSIDDMKGHCQFARKTIYLIDSIVLVMLILIRASVYASVYDLEISKNPPTLSGNFSGVQYALNAILLRPALPESIRTLQTRTATSHCVGACVG